MLNKTLQLVTKYMHGFITGGKCGRFVLINKWFFWGESALRSIWHYSQSGSHKVIYDIRSGPSHCLFYQFKVGPDSGDDDRVSEWEYQHRDVRNIQWSNSGTNFFKTFFCHKRWICKHRPNFDVTFEVLLIYNFCQNDLTLKGAILSAKNWFGASNPPTSKCGKKGSWVWQKSFELLVPGVHVCPKHFSDWFRTSTKKLQKFFWATGVHNFDSGYRHHRNLSSHWSLSK